jgi:hypothetical protein
MDDTSLPLIEHQVPLFDDRFNGIDPHVIGHEAVGRVCQDDDITLFARLQAADAVGPVDGGGAV